MHKHDTPDILATILARKQAEVAERKGRMPLEKLKQQASGASPARGFHRAIEETIAAGEAAVVAELKKASPSKGVLRADYEPGRIAAAYESGGAACLSVLTDRDFFQGSDRDLETARSACGLPVLRKDFIMDPYQVYESRALGADCILLIVAALGDGLLQDLAGISLELGMDTLVEVHDREELERAMILRTPLIGINNRDLRTFKTDINTTLGLMVDVFPDRTVITESGIHTRSDVATLRKHGVNAFLVGEAFMSAADPARKLEDLFRHGGPAAG